MRKPSVKDLWLEYRVAQQYSKLWDRAEENVALIRRKELSDSLPTQDDIRGLASTSSTGGSPAYWMSQVDPPRWFKRDELGIGTGCDVYQTLATLATSNHVRQRQYTKRLAELAKARKVLGRRVHNSDRQAPVRQCAA